VSIGLDHS